MDNGNGANDEDNSVGAMGAMGDDFGSTQGSYDLDSASGPSTADLENAGFGLAGTVAAGIAAVEGGAPSAAAIGMGIGVGHAANASAQSANMGLSSDPGVAASQLGGYNGMASVADTSVSTGGPAASSNDGDAWGQIFSSAAASGSPYELVPTSSGGTALIGGPTGSTEQQYITAGTGWIDPSNNAFVLLQPVDNMGSGGGNG